MSLAPVFKLARDLSIPSDDELQVVGLPKQPQYRKSTTASELLARFTPKTQSVKPQHTLVLSKHYPLAMTSPKALRRKTPVSYAESDDSSSQRSGSPGSAFSSPEELAVPRRNRKRTLADLDVSDDEIQIPATKTPPPRVSSAGHSLRQHKDLNLSLKAIENSDKPTSKRSNTQRAKKRRASSRRQDIEILGPDKSARVEVREAIASETAARRTDFFVAMQDYFLPLLPENNYIQRQSKSYRDKPKIQPYELVTQQPAGVKATMKPYQLAGLSFMVYLHKNGLSGILGDEMGLGKTLQTLSHIQYLKEHRDLSKGENRPSIVVCPLSVLSSWMSEARRWTPGLKVLRFHGPAKERDRLKRIASGEEDIYGNKTVAARKKANSRLNAKGKQIVDLEAEEEDTEAGVDLIVTTYEGFLAEQSWFKRAFVWRYVILDEGHKIKNDLSLVSKALQGLGAEYRLILTGTPLQNNLVELWALLHWLYPEVFTDKTSDLFRSSFDLTKGKVSTSVMDNARRLLEIIMLRRMKNSPGVDLNLPPKTEVLLYVPLSPMQQFWYRRLLTRADHALLHDLFKDAQQKASADEVNETVLDCVDGASPVDAVKIIEEFGSPGEDEKPNSHWQEQKMLLHQALKQEQQDEGKKTAWKKLMNLLMQLRKCCNHPYLLPHSMPDPYYVGDHVIKASGKLILLDKLIDELVIKQKEKVLIFSGFTGMLDCCEDFLSIRGGDGENFRYSRLDGGTGRARRNLGIRMFNQPESDYRVMLISTRAGGLGINLATASKVIMLDQDWNPQVMLQAESRAHRIGQSKPVTVYKLCTQGTVEEQMMGRIQKKLYLSAKVTESIRNVHSECQPEGRSTKGPRRSTDSEEMPHLDTNQLMSLVRRGAQALVHPELDVDDMLEWDWETTLEKCKDKPADVHIAKQTTVGDVKEADEKSWLAQMEMVESRVFQGQKFKKATDSTSYGDIAREWSREQRRVGKNTTVMVDGYAISKESMNCGEWEAVPTFAGKDPRLAEPKRKKKAPVINQDHCQVCWDGGELYLCTGCPRAYHHKCLDKDFQAKAKAKLQFSCPQHQCFDCEQKTTDAGGMIYRCRWCERGYCEDCLDWDKTELLGENLKEYEILGQSPVEQAFYIACPSCVDQLEQDSNTSKFCKAAEAEIDAKYEEMKEQNMNTLTDATTIESSGVSTPRTQAVDMTIGSEDLKRQSTLKMEMAPFDRSKRVMM